MPTRIPEPNKKPGLCYAYADNGLELPVIDVTHPSFHLVVDEAALFEGARRYAEEQGNKGFLARWALRWILPFALKKSLIGRGLLKSRGGYLDGMSTYLMKLRAEHLGDGWATPMDRKLVEGLSGSGLSVALRTQDMAETLAAGLKPLLQAGSGQPLHFVNIAGGPSMDNLNALLLLHKEDRGLLAQRSIVIHVLDLESEGAHFAAAALAALQAAEGPLQGLQASLQLLPYNWDDTKALSELLQSLPKDAIIAASSEGGLFDYAPDAAVTANLQALHADAPADAILGASLSRPDGLNGMYQRNAIANLALRSLADLERLARPTGWTVTGHRARPMNFVVGLKKA